MLKKMKNYWFSLPKIIRFLFIGSYNFAVSFAIFVVLIFLLTEKNSQLCLILSYIISSFNSYFSQKFFVFQTKGNYFKEYIKCSVTWGIGYILNAILLKILQDILLINVIVSQFAALAMVSGFTYILFKYFSFKTNKE